MALLALIVGSYNFRQLNLTIYEQIRSQDITKENREMSTKCNCDQSIEPDHEHCKGCDCILHEYDGETLCKSCLNLEDE